ncbi:pilus assembly protein TadG-related protein [Thiobacter aerophilum]|uniref:Pilus assembly protein TadG-related protein n=1 Tax=Thiobacter aerophilum TaxID=3121275 RepID=A0ABV0EGX6_9BURK
MKRHQVGFPARGQALILGLAFLFLSAVVMFYAFNSGQAVTEKIRLTNAADAAAYSAATLEARALNYDAYVNRTMVANEIAIAQVVSFVSWAHYSATLVENAGALDDVAGSWIFNPGDYTELAQLMAVITGTAYLNAYTGGEGTETFLNYVDTLLPSLITAHDTAVRALSASQTVLHASLLLGISQRSLADEIVKKIDPAMAAEVVLTSYDFDRFTKAYGKSGSTGDERGRFAEVTTASRDRFTRERVWTLSGPTIWPLQKDVALKRRGGTDLVGYDEWRAMDTLEHHGQRLGCGKFGLDWCGDVQQSISWGAAQVNALGADQGHGYHGGSYAENSRTSKKRADPAMVDLTASGGAVFSGLPTSRDLADLAADGSQRTGITIRVTKPRSVTRTSGGASIIQPGGDLAQFGADAPGSVLAALSRAEVFFDRPVARSDGRQELASLYNPYWQVRLVAPTAGDKAYAAAWQKGLALP